MNFSQKEVKMSKRIWIKNKLRGLHLYGQEIEEEKLFDLFLHLLLIVGVKLKGERKILEILRENNINCAIEKKKSKIFSFFQK